MDTWFLIGGTYQNPNILMPSPKSENTTHVLRAKLTGDVKGPSPPVGVGPPRVASSLRDTCLRLPSVLLVPSDVASGT